MSAAMRVYVAADHAGFEFKTHLVGALKERGFDVVDVGAPEYDAADDYPPYCFEAASRVVADPGSLRVVIGGAGDGGQVAANKVRGGRAALAWDLGTAQLARQHNGANVLGIGARQHSAQDATAIVIAFLDTTFSGDERHARRIAEITAYETR